MWVGCF